MNPLPPESNKNSSVDLFETDCKQPVKEIDVRQLLATPPTGNGEKEDWDQRLAELSANSHALRISLGPDASAAKSGSRLYLVKAAREGLRLTFESVPAEALCLVVAVSGTIIVSSALDAVGLNGNALAFITGSRSHDIEFVEKDSEVLILRIRVSPTWSRTQFELLNDTAAFKNTSICKCIRQLISLLGGMWVERQLSTLANQFVTPTVRAIELLLDAAFTPEERIRPTQQSSRRYAAIIDWIDALGVRADCSMNSVAARCGLSARTVQRILAENGDSFSNALGNVRINKAIILLELGASSRSESFSIASVALAVGYRSSAAFSRAFKRTTGVSPSHWHLQ